MGDWPVRESGNGRTLQSDGITVSSRNLLIPGPRRC